MTQSVLQVNHLNKLYGKHKETQYHALKDVSFEMNTGEFVGIMGPSGAGKTTLLNVISTLDQATDGSVKIAGTDITKMKQNQLADFRSQQLGFIFQDFNLLENLTVYENIALPLSLQGVAVKQIKPSVLKVAENLGIQDILPKYPVTISGGQKQRVAAARALVHEPALILADEPTGALDSKNARSLMETFVHMNENLGTSIMLVTHDPLSASYCQRILFIQDGQLYKEIHRNHTRSAFHQDILNVLSEFNTPSEW
ncbi:MULTISPECIES: ABC transporter ATP-binding protein [Virgibacillus]|uniref:Bacitracin ABC transporter ATP-binding protein n=1 Tax=Virgibacillus pantothenticus TaxID=1473 RepID=A0A0L0QTC9_VIRPA|nr:MULTISPECIES: ABC transporter ATP-binding protein [Virgibacillus]API91930.1 bacitracin ABC transporter ATP-binding protein [Virgibacillus sp. 6R]KNE21438.1 bacitracin ABC transporter ATP-binding protein [Virgibacillus pantothenticus]MBS7430379.1 ABC transporter ATP-binding protein [Virgibacillus sp. 19R1-5]MBU8567351.1 ABC transporter ATP-binding protein [Virgibacillus pantothenticus]MBU8598932.1 ABC transporter ATP-binding protein [Virgibacillus pantothenticus]